MNKMIGGLASGAALVLLLPAVRAGEPLSYAQAQALMSHYGCPACHALDRSIKGTPSLLDIAHRYRSDPNAIEELAIHVHNGSVGVFGPRPMPPVDVPQGDLQTILKWILQLPLEPSGSEAS